MFKRVGNLLYRGYFGATRFHGRGIALDANLLEHVEKKPLDPQWTLIRALPDVGSYGEVDVCKNPKALLLHGKLVIKYTEYFASSPIFGMDQAWENLYPCVNVAKKEDVMVALKSIGLEKTPWLWTIRIDNFEEPPPKFIEDLKIAIKKDLSCWIVLTELGED